MFCKVLLNFWKDSEPEMSTITSTKTAIAAVARIYAKGIVDLLAFVFNILPLRPIIRILITAYLLTRTAWFLLGDAVPLPQTCLLYTSDAADEEDSVDLGGRRIIKKKRTTKYPP